MVQYTNQIQILHFSDLHFGPYHICNPPATGSSAGIPTLGELVVADLQNDFASITNDITDYAGKKECPLIAVVSGDFTETALQSEFDQASDFMKHLVSNKLLGREITRKEIFMVPGNHDVQFTSPSQKERFLYYGSFYNEFYQDVRQPILASKPLNFTQVHKIEKDGNKLLIVEINCSMYVQKDTVDSSRGQVDMEAIEKLTNDLKAISANDGYEDYIKIAIMHHHVVLLPAFIEDGRGVDSIQNAGYLLELLSENNFHLILHGHKHYPQIFNYEPLPLWSEKENRISQLVISGGSCGSKGLPDMVISACNTYSVITIKWHPAARQARIRVLTRGLVRKSDKPLPPAQWKWKTVNISDIIVAPYQRVPAPGIIHVDSIIDDAERKNRYKVQRLYMPVAEVMPSLIPGQAYEVRAWIVEHQPDISKENKLVKVEWTAGIKFKRVTCLRNENPNFCMAYHYWGPMLIQAKLIFEDGYEENAYVYARMPTDESAKRG